MHGRITHKLFFLKQYLLPGVRLRIKFFRKDASFSLMSPDLFPSYIINSQEVKLSIRCIEVDTKVHASIEKKLNSMPAIYSIYNAADVRTRHILPVYRSYVFDNFFSGERVLNRMIHAMVSREAYIGSYKRNPVNFHHHNIEEMSNHN